MLSIFPQKHTILCTMCVSVPEKLLVYFGHLNHLSCWSLTQSKIFFKRFEKYSYQQAGLSRILLFLRLLLLAAPGGYSQALKLHEEVTDAQMMTSGNFLISKAFLDKSSASGLFIPLLKVRLKL